MNTEKLDDHSELTSQEATASSSKPGQQLWIDGYICSICGFELPPGFEERQEHSDFHLAESLQQEEAVDSKRTFFNERYLCLDMPSHCCSKLHGRILLLVATNLALIR